MTSTASFPRQHLKKVFLTGATPTIALQSDLRFSYALYVPDAHYLPTPDSPRLPLVVVVHGTKREHVYSRDNLIPLADAPETACTILAPLFPVGILGLDDLSTYKCLVATDARQSPPSTLRYDKVLLAMLDEVAQRYPGIDVTKFIMAGYSGGGQFVHRFLYLHPEKVTAASIGAPGGITLLEEGLRWASEIDGSHEAESDGSTAKLAAMSKLKIQIVVGDNDIQTVQFALAERKDQRSRVDKARELAQDWQDHGVDTRFDIVPGVKHDRTGCAEFVHQFLETCLLERKT